MEFIERHDPEGDDQGSFSHRFNKRNLKNLFYSKIAGSPVVGIDRTTSSKFEENLDREINFLLKRVSRCNYKFIAYRLLLLPKGRGKAPREISIPAIRDRLCLAALAELIDDVYGSGCSTPHPQSIVAQVRALWREHQYTHCLKADLKGFYSSIDHDSLMSVLTKRLRKPAVLDLIRSSIETPSVPIGTKAAGKNEIGVPEGLSISNRLANIFASQLDTVFINMNNVAYFRYVDDILIFFNYFNYDPDSIIDMFSDSVEKVGLYVNKEKTHVRRLSDESLSFLGYVFDPNGAVTVREPSIKRLEQKIENDLRHLRGKHGKDREAAINQLNLRITGCRVTEDGTSFQRFGWLHYYSQISDISLLWKLDNVTAKISKRYNLDLQDTVKSFKKTYYEMRYKGDRTKYIPTFDLTRSVREKRNELKMLFPNENWDSKSEEDVHATYNRRIRNLANKLEKDVGKVS